MRVRVHYPLAEGELRLRAEPDWERSLAPRASDPARGRFEFELPLAGEHGYFKPVIEDGAGTRWARGENVLALRSPGRRGAPLEVYPYFAPDESCHVCERHSVPSSFGARDVRVFLPGGYEENSLQRFPVLYMQDGQNLFFPGEAPQGKHWRVGETLALLESMCLVRPVIVVGVYPGERMREYTRPGSDDTVRFLADELKPWIDARYRTRPEPEHTAVLGSSLGGVVALQAAWTRPEVFGMAGAMSATFGYADDLLARIGAEPRRALRIYLDSGWPRDNYEATRAVAAALRRRGWREGRELSYLAFPDGRHEEVSWAARVHLPFQFFFRG